jgi:hypothetical protein
LLGQLGELRRERAPIDEQLGRLDDTTSAHDEAVKMRDRLLEHDAAVAEAIARGDPRPPEPDALVSAEIALRRSTQDLRAIVAKREQLTLTLSNLNRREAELRAQVSELGSRHKTGRIAR